MFKLSKVLLLLVIALCVTAALAQDAPTLGLGSSETLGSYLVGPNGMTLYYFTPDPVNGTVCYGKCAENWPPLTVDSADAITVAEGIPGAVGTVTREDGTLQVTYNGLPLYYWVRDTAPGETTGNYVGRVWWIVPPATVSVQPNPTLGKILVGANGKTVYTFANDEMGKSNCDAACAGSWPPVAVASAEALVPGLGLVGELGTLTRDDGSLQVTYNGHPLYYWVADANVGDTTGEGVGNVWFTATPETVGVANNEALGDHLVTPFGLTLYMFTKDTAGVSNCAGDCLANWPAFTIGANDRLNAGALAGQLDTITRDDGARQVTYNGMPLYYWKDDKAAGDALGQGLNNVWFVVAP